MTTNKEGRKPQYKDYVHFLDTYRNGKKDESNNYSLTSSSNNSSSSLNTDYLNEQSNKGFKEYLESYENRKFSSVKPDFLKKNNQGDKKTIKTEIFINVNNQKSLLNSHSHSNDVNRLSKKIETKSNSPTTTKTVNSKVNKYYSQQSETESDDSESKKISVEEISKKFQTHGIDSKCTHDTKKTTLKKYNCIKEKSKIFENNSNAISQNTHCTNNDVAIQNGFKNDSKNCKQKLSIAVKPEISVSLKSVGMKIEPSKKTAHGEQEINSHSSMKSKSNEPNIVQEPIVYPHSVPHSNCVSNASPENCVSYKIPPPPPIPNEIQIGSVYNLPPPPPLPQNHVTERSSLDSQSSTEESSLPPSISPPVKINGVGNIPVPPPPPMCNFSTKKTSPPLLNKANNINRNGKKITVYNTLPKMQNSKSHDIADGTSTLDKNDPRVKKLVNTALREMYGAYHNQANNYIATLPKNRVRKNNGLDSIINSIALQGGLDKLSGRANPKIETELRHN